MRRAPRAVWSCAESVIGGLGYEFVGAQFGRQGRGGLLRVYIDAADGVDVEDCARVSQQLSAALDVDDCIRGAYVLEVSSPGLDRPLFSERDFAAHVGALVRVRLQTPLAGRRNFKGRLQRVGDARLVIEGEEVTWELDFADIDEARLVPVY